MGNKITDMTVASSLAGTELLFASVSNAPRSVTPAVIAAYILDQIEAISAGTTIETGDKLYYYDATDGVFKPILVSTVAQLILDGMWAKTAETAADGADVIPLKDGGVTEKTLTLALLAAYILTTIRSDVLNVSDLADGSGTLAVTDYMLVVQGTTPKQITVDDLNTLIYDSLAAHVAGKSDVVTPTGTDKLYLVRSGTAYYVTMTEIATFVGATATLSGTGTTGYLAKWSSSTALTAGPSITNSGTGFSVGADDSIPTSAAVRGEMDTIINDATAIGTALASADTFLVDDGGAGTQRKATIDAIKTYVETAGVYKTIWVPASAMHVRATNPAAALTTNEYATNDINLAYFAFDGGATEEAVQFYLPMPEDWDLGTIKAKFFWSSATASTTADTVEWGIKAGALTNDDAIDAALGTAQVVSDALLADNGTDLQLTAATPALTIGGAPASGDLVVFEVYRNTDGTDDMVEDAWLFGVWLQYQATVQPSAW